MYEHYWELHKIEEHEVTILQFQNWNHNLDLSCLIN
jgi:hypothetical protein